MHLTLNNKVRLTTGVSDLSCYSSSQVVESTLLGLMCMAACTFSLTEDQRLLHWQCLSLEGSVSACQDYLDTHVYIYNIAYAY